jgi:predicted transposase YbfD/YdcC
METLMTYPAWVKEYKKKGTSIVRNRGRYYLYEYSTVWNKEKKRAKKITGKYLGVITEEHGLIPPGQSRRGRVPKGASTLKQEPKVEAEFLDHFEEVNDERATRNRLYSVDEILLIALAAVICGAEGWQDIENFGKAKLNYLRKFFDFKHGVPSDDTFRRFFRSLEPNVFKELFREWIEELALSTGSKVIAIDGKANRRSYDGDGNMIHMVSAFACEARIVLGQEKVDNKSNEITAIPKLLEALDISGHIITIDAMGCQFEIANNIVNKEADYVFSLKGNQGNLCDDVVTFFEDSELKKECKSFKECDKAHGRLETRECFVCNDVQWLRDRHPKWQTIKSIVQVSATRNIKDKETHESRHFISSLEATPEEMLRAIRFHWGIENSLHWILDMSFNEDYSRIRKGNAPQIMAIMRHMALNLLQKGSEKGQSIKGLRKLCAWNDDILDKILIHQRSS